MLIVAFVSKSLKATMLVIITFAALWVGMFVMGVISTKFSAPVRKKDDILRIARRLKTRSHDEDQIDVKSALQCYISSFFPAVFSNKPKVARFWHGLTVSYYCLLQR